MTRMRPIDAILEAARQLARLEHDGAGTFTLAQLAVTAWCRDRGRLGLAGYEHAYPDVRTIATQVYGRRGLVAKGVLERVAPSVFRATPDLWLDRRQLLRRRRREKARQRKEAI